MKYAVKIMRIVMCAIVSFYTLYVCGHTAHTAYYKCALMGVSDGAMYMEWGMLSKEGLFYFIMATMLLLLGAASVFLLFRDSLAAAISSGVCAMACAWLGMFSNTELSEFMFLRYQLALPSFPVELLRLIKPLLAQLCIEAAVLYVGLYLIFNYRQRKEEHL